MSLGRRDEVLREGEELRVVEMEAILQLASSSSSLSSISPLFNLFFGGNPRQNPGVRQL
jgi:hypothetical protein